MKDILSTFGKHLILDVRDNTIEDAESLLTASSKAPSDQKLQSKLMFLSNEERETIRELIYLTVDSSLHNLLWLMEESTEFDICYKERGKVKLLSHESDGLAGELYTEDGWIEQFSKYPISG